MSYSPLEWAVLEELYKHIYDTTNRGSKPDDPGWHVCLCGCWEGYWCDWQPHVARLVSVAIEQRKIRPLHADWPIDEVAPA